MVTRYTYDRQGRLSGSDNGIYQRRYHYDGADPRPRLVDDHNKGEAWHPSMELVWNADGQVEETHYRDTDEGNAYEYDALDRLVTELPIPRTARYMRVRRHDYECE